MPDSELVKLLIDIKESLEREMAAMRLLINTRFGELEKDRAGTPNPLRTQD
jgi:hypothetical protein